MAYVVLAVVAFHALSWVAFAFWEELGTNMLADSVALAFGVFVVNRLVKEADDVRRRPELEAAFQDGAAIFMTVHGVLRMALECGVHRDEADALQAALHNGGVTDGLPHIMAKVRLVDETNEFTMASPGLKAPGQQEIRAMTWRDYLLGTAKRVTERAQGFTARYPGLADSALVVAVRGVERSQLIQMFAEVGVFIQQTPSHMWASTMAANEALRSSLLEVARRKKVGDTDLAGFKLFDQDLIDRVRAGALPHPRKHKPVRV